jgi:hypothetical protein
LVLGIRQRIIAAHILVRRFLISVYTGLRRYILKYTDRPSFPSLKERAESPCWILTPFFAILDQSLSLVDPRVRPLMNSRKLDSRYRTARPIFTNRGPSPESRDLASQDKETLRILAASRGCSRGSIGLAFPEAFMPFSSSSYLLLDGAIWRFILR